MEDLQNRNARFDSWVPRWLYRAKSLQMARFCGKRRSDVERQRTSTNAPFSDRTYTRTYTRQTPPADIADGSASRPACLRGHELGTATTPVRMPKTESPSGHPVQAYTDGTSRRGRSRPPTRGAR
jgi:hypothetical protein